MNGINPDTVVIWETPDDGSCFFFAVAHQLLANFEISELEINDIKVKIASWERVYKSEDFSDEIIKSLAEYLQSLIYKFIIENPYEIINIGFETTIENAVFIIHEITLDEYRERYQYFAGEKVKIKEKVVNDRWGSTLEQIILAKLLGIKIVVYTPQVFNQTQNKYKSAIYKDGKFQRNTVFNKMTSFDYAINDFTVFLLWKKFYGKGHYMGLYIGNYEPTILAVKL